MIAAADADWIAVAVANGVRPRITRNWILRDSTSLKKRGATKENAPHTKLINTVIETLLESLVSPAAANESERNVQQIACRKRHSGITSNDIQSIGWKMLYHQASALHDWYDEFQ